MRKMSTTVGPYIDNGRKIYYARRRKGLTQTQLGNAAGITYRQIIRLENGQHLPRERVRDLLVEALGLKEGTLASCDDEPEGSVYSGDPFRGSDNSASPGRRGKRKPRARTDAADAEVAA